ncbi:MAG: hypothetical protein QE509_13405 [Gammaproteobacteria bacterium]|nr:hypothetical protein [Gammaproteobacteria bacterium]
MRLRLASTLLLASAAGVCAADALTDIGFRALQTELGSALAKGTNITITQVEANSGPDISSPLYRADPSTPGFSNLIFNDRSAGTNPGFSGHATGVAQALASDSFMTSGVPAIDSYEVNSWLNQVLYGNGANFSRPITSGGTLANHSWAGTAGSPTSAADIFSRLDWVIDQSNFIQVVGVIGNGNNLLGFGYNTINVGATPTPNSGFTTALDSFYGAGRTLPHLVGPWPNVSGATPLVTSAVALLEDSAPGYTLRPEVVKALLMAGADRQTRNTTGSALVAYQPDSTNGLDRRYGAGQLNVYNSVKIFSTGERPSVEDGGTLSANTGYHLDAAFGGTSGSNRTATYAMGTLSSTGSLMATLVWHPKIFDASGAFAPTRSLNNLDLELIDTTGGGGTVVASSKSTIENTENIRIKVSRGRSYSLRVSTLDASNFSVRYAIAWREELDQDGDGLPDRFETGTCPSATDADSDDDGITDGVEDANANGLVDAGETAPCEADTDGDGVSDGVEKSVTSGVADPDGSGPLTGTDPLLFTPDADPASQTDPTLADTDGDGYSDGQEDLNRDGGIAPGESDPGSASSIPGPAVTRQVPLPPLALVALGVWLAHSGRRRRKGANASTRRLH